MSKIILAIFGHIQLRIILLAAIITAIFVIAIFIVMLCQKHTIKKQTKHMLNGDIDYNNVNNLAQLNKHFRNSIFAICIACIFMLLFAFTYDYYNRLALKYGAYDNGQLLQSLNEINDSTIVNGFIDQSEKVPNNPKGCLIIYIKYGCPDCRKVHNDIIKCLHDNNARSVYFVSTRSELGKILQKDYPVTEVPSGVYIRQTNSTVSTTYTEILYHTGYDDNKNKVTYFDEDKLIALINHQKNGD